MKLNKTPSQMVPCDWSKPELTGQCHILVMSLGE